MELEHGVSFGREVKRADIVIFDKDKPFVIMDIPKQF